jgi:hypothetical protein
VRLFIAAAAIALLTAATESATASRAPVMVRLGTVHRDSLAVGTEIVCSTPVRQLVVRVPTAGESQAQATTTTGVRFNLSVFRDETGTPARCLTFGEPIYRAAATRACLAREGVVTGAQVGFVPPTTTAGTFRATVNANVVSIAFATTDTGAELAISAYSRTVPKDARPGLANRLRRYDNAVTFWRAPPLDSELGVIVPCLR